MEATKLDVLETMNDAEIQEAWRVLRVSRDLDALGLFDSRDLSKRLFPRALGHSLESFRGWGMSVPPSPGVGSSLKRGS